MKLENNAPEAYVSKNVEVHQASISMTKEVFNILVKGIYKDPYKAVVRELICNARDTQVEAKVLTPLLIHVPTPLEPFFSVKDNGLGMSKEMVTKTFMQLGNSTKRESNELIGAKGIGSKSPFSIVDAYSVNSIYNGVKTSYSVYMNKGIPDVAVLFENETDQCNGVEIKVAIPTDKVNHFNTKVAEFLSLFDYPYILNDSELAQKIKYPEVAYTRQVGIFKVNILSSETNMLLSNQIIMGGVGYSSAALEDLGNEDFLVDVPIGAVDISPGREYTEEVDNPDFVSALKKAVENTLSSYYAQIVKSVEVMPDIKEISEYYNKQTHAAKLMLVNHYSSKYSKENLIEKITVYKERRKGWAYKFVGSRSDIEMSEVLSGKVVLMIKDKKNNLKLRAELLTKQLNVDIIYSVDEDSELINHPLLKGVAHYASEAAIEADKPKPKKVSLPRVGLKGHVVHMLDAELGVVKRRFSKSDFESIDLYLTKSCNSNADVHVQGYGYVTKAMQTMLADHNVMSIYLLTERQIKWAINAKKFEPTVSGEIKTKLKEKYLSTDTPYNKTVEKYNLLRKVKNCSGRFKSKNNEHIPSWVYSYADNILNNIKKNVNAIYKDFEDKYQEERNNLLKMAPVLKHLSEDLWETKEVKDYVKLMGDKNVQN